MGLRAKYRKHNGLYIEKQRDNLVYMQKGGTVEKRKFTTEL